MTQSALEFIEMEGFRNGKVGQKAHWSEYDPEMGVLLNIKVATNPFQCTVLWANECHFANMGLIRVKIVALGLNLSPLQRCSSFFGSYEHKEDS